MIKDLIKDLIGALCENTKAVNDLRDSIELDDTAEHDDEQSAAAPVSTYMDGTPIG